MLLAFGNKDGLREPGEPADVSVPDGRQGRAQKYGGRMDDPSIRAEFNNAPADAYKGRAEARPGRRRQGPRGNANLTMKMAMA